MKNYSNNFLAFNEQKMTINKSQALIIQTLLVLMIFFIILFFVFEAKVVLGQVIAKPDSDLRIYSSEIITEKPDSSVIISDPETINSKDEQIQQIIREAKILTPVESSKIQYPYEPTLDMLVAKYGIVRDKNKEFGVGHSLLAKIYSEYKYSWEAELKKEGLYEAMIFFITYNHGTTADLGAGERAGVINSWKDSKDSDEICIPKKTEDWEDIIKIANGRWPNVVSENDYVKSKEDVFRQIYLRDPDYALKNDEAAMMIMAYGLRPEPRSLEREEEAASFFKEIFKKDPETSFDWDIIRAIAYSGAIR